MKRTIISLQTLVVFVFLILLTFPTQSKALTADEIRRNIEDKNAQINSLNSEIKKLDEQIQTTSQEGKNLQSAIQTLNISGQKLDKELTVTKNKISNTSLTIQQLETAIKKHQDEIQKNMDALMSSIRTLRESDDTSVIESVLANKNLGGVWNDLEALSKFQSAVKTSTDKITQLKKQLETQKSDSEQKKKTLVSLTDQLSDQKQIVDNNKREKDALLVATKNKQQNYQKILDEKKKQSEAFAQDLATYEAQLKFIIDPNSYPSTGKGILSWPLDNVFVTQYFGDTEFSKTNAYNGKGHNGIDLRASRGTPVKAAASGVVEGTGNTSLVPGCYSYGKWVLLRHNNGLSTIYGHLDLIKAVPGASVNVGDIIGYSGNTGYATGPHLHFGVYATQGVRIMKLAPGRSKNCTGAVLPIAETKAYLNPILYL